MNDERKVVVPGEPKSKERPRVTKNGTYTPEATLNAEEAVGWHYRKAQRHPPITGPCVVTVEFHCARPGHGDIDNLCKTVLDGLNGVAYVDDKQVTELRASVVPADPKDARTEFTVLVRTTPTKKVEMR